MAANGINGVNGDHKEGTYALSEAHKDVSRAQDHSPEAIR